MARRRPAAATQVEELANSLLPIMDEFTRTPCPECGQYTLYPEMTMRSGVIVKCEGISRHSEDNLCGFKAFAFQSGDRELPRLDTPVVDS